MAPSNKSEIASTTAAFFNPADVALTASFLRQGFVIQPVADAAALDRIRDHLAATTAAYLGLDTPTDSGTFLNKIHEKVSGDQLNDLRLAVIQNINQQDWLRPSYFAIARDTIETLIGNELVMQRRVNLSIQMPHDDTSLLPVHADVWSGDSAFEAVLWIPLVDVFATKSMYIASPETNADIESRFKSFGNKSAEDLYREIESQVTFLDIPYGHVLLFNQNLMHGNRLNIEAETRWSMNCRFKSVLSPYADKKLGEFFEPITLRAMTRIGMEHALPNGFEE
jgi:sporadic carbohydrate cluster 2OG-Fe(II) oxygenase